VGGCHQKGDSIELFLCLAIIESPQLEQGGPFLSYYLCMNGLRKKSCHCRASISEGFLSPDRLPFGESPDYVLKEMSRWSMFKASIYAKSDLQRKEFSS